MAKNLKKIDNQFLINMLYKSEVDEKGYRSFPSGETEGKRDIDESTFPSDETEI